jgi:hypothetical protein
MKHRIEKKFQMYLPIFDNVQAYINEMKDVNLALKKPKYFESMDQVYMYYKQFKDFVDEVQWFETYYPDGSETFKPGVYDFYGVPSIDWALPGRFMLIKDILLEVYMCDLDYHMN